MYTERLVVTNDLVSDIYIKCTLNIISSFGNVC